MIDCLIMGDSIAQGIAENKPECHRMTRIGISSASFNDAFLYKIGQVVSDTVLISLGSNDGSYTHTYDRIKIIRHKVIGKKVFWVLPLNNESARIDIIKVAKEFGDLVIDAKNYPISPDGIHPNSVGYRKIAEQMK